jgi:1,5-anhydro-D-fructose reductase (1,5-anhydro-D-mannitol-forming)
MIHKVGVIGLGVMGKYMFGALIADPHFEVIGSWDLDVLQCQLIRQQYPDIAIAQSAEALVSREDIELVYIATPPTTHVQYASLAIDHGKAVLCEKPLAVDIQSSRRLVEKARKSNIPNGVNFSLASSPEVEVIEKAIRDGELGELTGIEIRFHFPQWPRAWQTAGNWLSQREQGGFVREVFSHFAYITHRLIGPLMLKWSAVTYPDESNHSESYAIAEMECNGLSIHLTGGVGGAGLDHVEWTLYGTQRSYRFLNWGTLQVGTNEGWEEVLGLDQAKDLQLTALSHMLEGKPHSLPDFGVGLEVQELVESILDYGSRSAL